MRTGIATTEPERTLGARMASSARRETLADVLAPLAARWRKAA